MFIFSDFRARGGDNGGQGPPTFLGCWLGVPTLAQHYALYDVGSETTILAFNQHTGSHMLSWGAPLPMGAPHLPIGVLLGS